MEMYAPELEKLKLTWWEQIDNGLAALGSQLRASGLTTSPKQDPDDPLAEDLMSFYERMGDTLAHQYGGSASHNKIFSARRGQWKAATEIVIRM